MGLIENLGIGLAVAFTPANLLYCFIGALFGTLVGVLPGLGPLASIAMLLPLTFSLPPESALIMLSGIYYGAQYGGSTTAILLNLPGESSSVVTAIDGYKMAQKGKAGQALVTAALGSFFAGSVATLLIAVAAPPLAKAALNFGATEYFALMVLGLVAAISLASGSILKAFIMAVLGIVLGLAGTDVQTAVPRFTFNVPELADGINFVAISMGVFGIAEILRNLTQESSEPARVHRVGRLRLSGEEFKQIIAPVLRGTGIGSVLGILPGGGALLASFASYAVEKKTSRKPHHFGHGAIEGIAGPEAANNAGAQTSFIPMLTLGIPSNPVMALMIGALILQGIQPGPNVVVNEPRLFWSLIVSMWVGNLMLIVLNLPLVGIWVKMLAVPYNALFPAIVAFTCIGVFSVSNSSVDVLVMAGFGLVGFILIRLDFEPAPMLLGFILGPMLEENLRRALTLSRGNYAVFFTNMTSVILLAVALVMLLLVLIPSVRAKRDEALVE